VSGAALALEHLSLRLGRFELRDIDLALSPGEILVLLGPNGAGKSVTLETVAGFHRLEAGRIRLGGRDITDLAPEHRRISLLFQNFALFPHLTVAGNVALALRAARRRVNGTVTALLERFAVAELADCLPETLSPGEKQRAALARALAAAPELFLFDEPFSALDGPTRAGLRDRLKQFLRESGITAVFVTHDHAEALALGDTLALLRAGAIVQRGPAVAVYRRPETVFAARFLGVENILEACFAGSEDGLSLVAIGETQLRAEARASIDARRPLSLGIRAEDVVLSRGEGAGDAANRLGATVTAVAEGGALTRVTLDCGFPLTAALPRREALALAPQPGMRVCAEIEPAAVQLLG